MQRVKVTIPAQAINAKRIWDNYAVIGEVQKSDRIKFVIGAGVRDGVKYINIREFYLRVRDSIWKPGRDGITIPLQIPIEKGTKIITPYTEVLNVLRETVEALEVMELADEDNAIYAERKDINVKVKD